MHSIAKLFGSKQSLEQEIKSSPVISDIVESIQLVTEGFSTLFINKSLSQILKKTIETQDSITKIKKQIIYRSQSLDGSKVIDVLQTLSKEQITLIGQEFLLVTAKKFAKSQPIEKYAQFLKFIYEAFGLDEQFLKCFIVAERDATEVQFFVSYISKWNLDNIKEILHFVTIYFLERFAIQGQFEDYFEFFNCSFENLSKDFQQDTLLNLYTQLLQHAIIKDYSSKIFEKSINVFFKKNFELNLIVANKILDTINRYHKEEDFMSDAMKMFEEHKIEFNLFSYNLMMDHFCNTGRFLEAKKIFDEFPEKEIQPDSYSYSILIKGLKNFEQDRFEHAMNLFRKYKRTVTDQELIVYNSLLDLLAFQKDNDKVDKIFDDLISSGLKPDEITFNTIIKGSCKQKNLELAMTYFEKMKTFGLSPNRITYNSLMDLSVKIEKMNIALKLIEAMYQDDITPDSFTYSIILNGLKLNNSSQNLVRMCLQNIKKVILADEFKQDQVLFNSILDVATKYNLVEEVEAFHQLMKQKRIKDSPQTSTFLITAYTQANQYEKAIELFKRMINSGMKIKEAVYGLVLECCTRNERMDLVIEVYDHLKDHYFNMNSIVFTTIIKGYIKSKNYQEAIKFFNTIKNHLTLPGMIITYNCALDVYANVQDIEGAMKLFEEIETHFQADLISYSTLIKTLCNVNRKQQALEYLKKMLKSKIQLDVSVVNLFLESCSSKDDFKLAIEAYKFAMMQNIEPNEITFGIMVKVYGFARELENAFELIDLMRVYNINPSIIVYTNLIHISFYCREPRKAELAYQLFKKSKLEGDGLLYSKIIDGLIRFRQTKKVPKYIKYCLEEKCCLNERTIESIKKYFQSEEMDQTLQKIQSFKNQKKGSKNVGKFINNYNLENPKKFKKQIREQRIQIRNSNLQKGDTPEKEKDVKYSQYSSGKKKVLHNFRRNKIDQ